MLHVTISTWLSNHKHHIENMDAKYIKLHLHHNKQNPFGQFYVTYKIHKGMQNNKWPTRPVCSDVSSLPHGLGKWVDHMLQPIAAAQPSHLKDSFTLKHDIHLLRLPPRALLFTSDAKSMYTCIPTEPALDLISSYLRTNENNTFHHYNSNTLIKSLQIVFRNNLIQFGDTYWQQILGTGMLISPADGQPYSTASMKNNSCLNGHNMASTTNDLLMTSSAFGSHTPTKYKTMNYGKCSNTTCKAGMDWNGNSLNPRQHATSWTSPFQSPIAKSQQPYTKRNKTFTSTSHPTQPIHLESSMASSSVTSYVSTVYALTSVTSNKNHRSSSHA
jgi:hypothetical protein